MEPLLFIIIGILLLTVFALSAKIYFLRKGTQEITEGFQDRLTADTNTLIDISSRDPSVRKLASKINRQLRLLRRERQRYQQGDLELKEAVTNISHDLRTPLTAISGYLDLLEREGLFDRFYTVEDSRNSTGLGLSIAKLLTERMGGTMEADYRDGRLYIKIAFPTAV